jgi:hypothetical protein
MPILTPCPGLHILDQGCACTLAPSPAKLLGYYFANKL